MITQKYITHHNKDNTMNNYNDILTLIIIKITSRIETLESRKRLNTEHIIPECRDINDCKIEELTGLLHFLLSFKGETISNNGENTPK